MSDPSCPVAVESLDSLYLAHPSDLLLAESYPVDKEMHEICR
jgi:hypothetical protein